MNTYNGNVTTDARGIAVVRLPDYFEALNQDFRYQLTCIGKFARAIVLKEIKGNSFRIKTDAPRVRVLAGDGRPPRRLCRGAPHSGRGAEARKRARHLPVPGDVC